MLGLGGSVPVGWTWHVDENRHFYLRHPDVWLATTPLSSAALYAVRSSEGDFLLEVLPYYVVETGDDISSMQEKLARSLSGSFGGFKITRLERRPLASIKDSRFSEVSAARALDSFSSPTDCVHMVCRYHDNAACVQESFLVGLDNFVYAFNFKMFKWRHARYAKDLRKVARSVRLGPGSLADHE